jgi:regulator of sigma E protease
MDLLALNLPYHLTQTVWPLVMFLIGLGLVVFVHELGHFIAAKLSGVKVEEFALGFGPQLVKLKKGETEYAIRALPLGGFVKMLGQEDINPMATAEHDPRSWQRARTRSKLAILAAGVTMNVIFAAIVFVIIYMIGVRFPAPVVGEVREGFPAATVKLPNHVPPGENEEEAVGLKRGDRILAINGEPVRRFMEVKMPAVLSGKKDVFTLTVARQVGGERVEFDVRLKPQEYEDAKFGRTYVFGIGPAMNSMTIAKPGDRGYTGQARFKSGDRIVAVAGRKVEHFWDIEPILRDRAGQPVTLTVQREGAGRVEVPLDVPAVIGPASHKSKESLVLVGMSPRVRVDGVQEGFFSRKPAQEAGLKEGDIILNYGGMGPPSRGELLKLNEEFAGDKAPITVLRDGKQIDLTISPEKKDETALISILAGMDDEPIVARVQDDTPAAEAGIPEGARILSVAGTEVTDWSGIYAALRKAGPGSVRVAYEADSETKTAELTFSEEDFEPGEYRFLLPGIREIEPLRTDPIRGNPAQAIVWAAEDTGMWIYTAIRTLGAIFTGRTTAKGLSGPVGIGVIAVAQGREGVIELAYFMAMLSALVAVFNFLPLPVLDGGHVVIVLIEKALGRPLPKKVLAGIQIAGLVLILGIFVAITLQDINRFFL